MYTWRFEAWKTHHRIFRMQEVLAIFITVAAAALALIQALSTCVPGLIIEIPYRCRKAFQLSRKIITTLLEGWITSSKLSSFSYECLFGNAIPTFSLHFFFMPRKYAQDSTGVMCACKVFLCAFQLFQVHLIKECILFYFLKKLFIYFLKRQEGRRKERKRNWYVRDTSISCFSYALNQGPGPQPRHVPILGTEPLTFQSAGQHSTHWATSNRAHVIKFFKS